VSASFSLINRFGPDLRERKSWCEFPPLSGIVGHDLHESSR
jgi:hypothetical protein